VTKNGGGAILGHVRTLFSVGTIGGLTDGELLERFAARQGAVSETAFAALIERHGPMVLRVCRGVLSDPEDARDAFQATFLVLVRRAGSIRSRESVASWLHGVAYRTASCARSATARRKRHERRAGEMSAIAALEDHTDDRWSILHEELHRLSPRFRDPIVLCDLEGLTHERAAERLSLPVGTVKSRLARGRERLRSRLVRRGLAPTIGVMTIVAAGEPAVAGVPAALAGATVQTAIRSAAGSAIPAAVAAAVSTLSERTLMTMFCSSLKPAAVVALTVLTAATIVPGFLAASDRQSRRSGDTPPEQKAEVIEKAEGRAGRKPGNESDEQERNSAGKAAAIALAKRAFGPEHWSADPDLPGRYYNRERGYWMYYKEYERRNDGRQVLFKPFALISGSPDKKELKTLTADEAVLDLDRPLEPSAEKPGTPPLRVVSMVVTGRVRIRDYRGTTDRGDDLEIGPMAYAEYDVPTAELRSESEVVIQGGNLRITGFDLRIAIDLMGSHTGTGPVGRIDEATPMFLRKEVRIVIDDDGHTIRPAGVQQKVPPAP
jgi:RNA polymerase sigma factor (sigma-70 family)